MDAARPSPAARVASATTVRRDGGGRSDGTTAGPKFLPVTDVSTRARSDGRRIDQRHGLGQADGGLHERAHVRFERGRRGQFLAQRRVVRGIDRAQRLEAGEFVAAFLCRRRSCRRLQNRAPQLQQAEADRVFTVRAALPAARQSPRASGLHRTPAGSPSAAAAAAYRARASARAPVPPLSVCSSGPSAGSAIAANPFSPSGASGGKPRRERTRSIGAAARDHQQPGDDDAARRVVALGLTPGLREHVLHDFFRFGRIADDPERERIDDAGMAIVEKRQGVGITARDAADGLEIFRGRRGLTMWGALALQARRPGPTGATSSVFTSFYERIATYGCG